MDCFNCPNQWNCKTETMDAVIQGKSFCNKCHKANTDTILQSKVWNNGGYLYKAIADITKGR